MRFRLLLSLLPLSVGLSFCTPSRDPEPIDWDFYKQPDAAAACVSNNLSQWELSGTFIHSLLRCASNRLADGGESLPATQALLASLDSAAMQRLIDFLLLSDPEGKTHEERYPYLVAFASLLDRDLSRDASQRDERLGSLQDFLLSLDVARSQKLLAHWSRSGRLEELMASIGHLLEGLQDSSVSALTHELLAGQTLRDPFLQLSRPLLQNAPLMAAFERSLSGEASRAFSPSERGAQIETWRQPSEKTDRTSAPSEEGQPALTPAARWDAYARSLSDGDWSKLAEMILEIWRGYRSDDAAEQASRDTRIIASLEHAIDQQAAPSLWLSALASDVRSMKAADFKEVVDALERLLSEEYDPTLDSLRAKIGASKLIELTGRLLSEGGAVPGCSGLTLPALAQAESFAAYAATLQLLSQPQVACGEKTPLDAAFAAWTACEACLVPRDRAPEQVAPYWADTYQAPQPEALQALLRTSLTTTVKELRADPYTLKNRGLAPGAVPPQTIEGIAAELEELKPQSLEELAAYDEKLNTRFKGLLAADWLEQLLAQGLETLASRASQFYDLVPETAENSEREQPVDQRATRVFAGIYSQGPIEAALAERLQPTRFLREEFEGEAALKDFFAQHPAALSWFLERQRRSEGIFRYPTFAVQTNEELTPFVSLGSSLQNYVSFSSSEASPRLAQAPSAELIQPTQAIQNFDPYERSKFAAWGLWSQQLASSALVSKDMPPQLARSFESWSRESWLPRVSDPARWQDLSQQQAPAWAQEAASQARLFYDTEAYSPAEARLVTLYMLRHHLKLPLDLPPTALISADENPSANSSNFTTPVRGFMSAAYMVSPGSDYSLFAKLFPAFLSDPSRQTLESLQAAALPPLSDVEAQEGFFPYARQNLIRDVKRLDASTFTDSFRLFSTFNLLSFTRAGTGYFPQPLIGIGGQMCRSSETQTRACPIEIEASDTAAAYARYEAYVSGLLAQHFCPLIAQDTLGPAAVWRERLGLRAETANSCAAVDSLERLSADSLRSPPWLTAWILDDIFTMGKAAKLKPGLAQIPAAMRYYKLQSLPARQRSQHWLRESFGVWSPANAASQSRRQYYAASFWAGAPRILASLIDAQRQKIEPEVWKQALVQLAERDAAGEQRDTLRQLLRRGIDTQARLATGDASALALGLDFIQALDAHPEERRLLAYMLADYSSAENYDFMGNDLPLAILGLFEDRFDWQNPGLRFSKFLAQRETLQTWSQIGSRFGVEELDRLLARSAQALRALGSLPEQERLLGSLLDEGLALGGLWQSEQKRLLAQSWDELLKSWRALDLGLSYRQAWAELLAGSELPLRRLDGQEGPSLANILGPQLGPLLARTPSLVLAHQASGQLEEELFWPRLLDDGLASMAAHPEGSAAAARWLGSEALGFDKSARWQRLFVEAEARRRVSVAMEAISGVAEETWRAAALETTELLPRLEKPLRYLKNRLIWRVDPEHNAFRDSLDRLYLLASDAVLPLKQSEWIARWLDDEPSSPEGEAP